MNDKKNSVAEVEVKVSVSGIDEAEKKVERLIELLKEANSLADELASCFNEEKKIVLDGKPIIFHQENHD